MDWKLCLTAFATVFIAELGDKTQLAALGLSSANPSPWVVFLGASAALIASTAIAVWAGQWLGSSLDPTLLQKASGILFIALGVWTLWGSSLT